MPQRIAITQGAGAASAACLGFAGESFYGPTLADANKRARWIADPGRHGDRAD